MSRIRLGAITWPSPRHAQLHTPTAVVYYITVLALLPFKQDAGFCLVSAKQLAPRRGLPEGLSYVKYADNCFRGKYI